MSRRNQCSTKRNKPAQASRIPIAWRLIPTLRVLAGTFGCALAMPLLSAQGAIPIPLFSPAPGTYSSSVPVTLFDTAPGTSIYYTTEGTAPTRASILYIKPINVATQTTVQAIAIAPDGLESAVLSGTFIITPPSPSTITGDVVISATTTWTEATYNLNSLTVTNGAQLIVAGGSILNVAGSLAVTGGSSIILQSLNSSAQVNGQWNGQGVL